VPPADPTARTSPTAVAPTPPTPPPADPPPPTSPSVARATRPSAPADPAAPASVPADPPARPSGSGGHPAHPSAPADPAALASVPADPPIRPSTPAGQPAHPSAPVDPTALASVPADPPARPSGTSGHPARPSSAVAGEADPLASLAGRLVQGLAAIAGAADAGAGAAAHSVLAERRDGTVVRVGGTVAKAHPVDSVPAELASRLALAGHPRLRGIVLAPRATGAELGGRPVSVWPYGEPVDRRQAQAAPWEDAAVLLARLHAVPLAELGVPLPEMRGPAKAARAMARLGALPDSPDAQTVRAAWRRLPPWARGEQPYRGRRALCHGDWHLGQLVRHPAPAGPWLLIDVDDLGAGDPAWDLARPAMWFAAGLLPGEAWVRFLAAYRAAGGTAVPPDGDPWPQLDVPARALAVQTAAIAVAKAARGGRALDPAESELLGACARIAQLE
jgi:Phosphotransferase enzyme family